MMENKPNKRAVSQLLASKRKHEDAQKPDLLSKLIINGDKSALSEAITLLESQKKEHQKTAQEILKQCIPHSEKSIRIGITGVPGVGKSTFIESFGSYLIEEGRKVAVLAIDPSSEISGGSILGDKTRMVDLSVNPKAYIRPSAARGSLGGVARKTKESIILCEAAGFDIILIETVGVGQSETAVHSMTDFFLLLMLSGAGDELQGIKRGIMEMADAILITKADGDNLPKAKMAKAQYKSALHLFPANDNGWTPQVELVSAIEKVGIKTIWDIIGTFEKTVRKNGSFSRQRIKQQIYWMHESVKEAVLNNFYTSEGINKKISEMIELLENGEMTSFQASEQILQFYLNGKKDI